jgi:AbiJ N-terminal domain 4
LGYGGNRQFFNFLQKTWHDYFKKPIDTIDSSWRSVHSEIRKYFFSCEWNEVYDFIEFVAANAPWTGLHASFRLRCNAILKEELSGFRFVGDDITAITAEEEIAEIEQAGNWKDRFAPATEHIRQAVRLLSDRREPDYRNSIKESISAVEAICQIVSDSQKITLADALKKMESRFQSHPAMRDAFSKLYGYTSDADGIRHALLDESSLRFEDAKYMLVTCSAFVNYLVAKSA